MEIKRAEPGVQDAKMRASDIRDGMKRFFAIRALVESARIAGDWKVLGHGSWEEYVTTRFSPGNLPKLVPSDRILAIKVLGLDTSAVVSSGATCTPTKGRNRLDMVEQMVRKLTVNGKLPTGKKVQRELGWTDEQAVYDDWDKLTRLGRLDPRPGAKKTGTKAVKKATNGHVVDNPEMLARVRAVTERPESVGKTDNWLIKLIAKECECSPTSARTMLFYNKGLDKRE